MTDYQLSSEDSDEEINLDRPYYLDPDTVLPEWVREKIETTDEYSFEDVFVSQRNATEDLCTTLGRQKLYPLTVICLLQLLMAKTNGRYHRLKTIMDQHKRWKIGYEREPDDDTYWEIVDDLTTVGIVERVKDGKDTKFGLPDGTDVAPAFDMDNPDNALDRITMDDPIPNDELEARILPGLRKAVRPQIRSVSGYLAWLGNAWDLGLKFLVAGVALTALYVETPMFASLDLTTAAKLFWALFSVGMTAMVVDILDQVRAGYQEANHC